MGSQLDALGSRPSAGGVAGHAFFAPRMSNLTPFSKTKKVKRKEPISPLVDPILNTAAHI
jgi:hypothetical protein